MTGVDVDRVMKTLRREMQADHIVYVSAEYVEKILRRDALMQEKRLAREQHRVEPQQVTLEEHMDTLFRK